MQERELHAPIASRGPNRREFSKHVGAGCLSFISGLSLPAKAQSRSLRIVVPYAAGSLVDVVPRMLAEHMASDLGHPVVIVNKPGGLGIPAVMDVLSGPADGTAILAADAALWAINPAMQPAQYNFLRDFTPVSVTFTNGLVFYSSASSGIRSLEDLIAQAKARPGELNYATGGIGTVHHLAFETLKSSLGFDMKHIAYRGANAASEAVLRNDVQISLTSLGVAAPLAAAGKIKLLAVSVTSRLMQLPQVPTVAEVTGLKDFHFTGQQGFVVKAGTPQPTIDRLAEAIRKAALQPDLYAKVLETTASEMTPTTPDQFTELIRSDIQRYAAAVKASGIKPQ